MTFFQQFARHFLYPARMWFSSLTGVGKKAIANREHKPPAMSFYDLQATSITGDTIFLSEYRGRNLLVVNLASFCGFTPQYTELETLWQNNKDKLVILGFPSNDFGGQEPGSNEEVAEFCRLNYGVSFPLFQKGPVSGTAKNEVYQWLTDPAKNGWNSREPNWNFCKYLLTKDGKLHSFFNAAISPLSEAITKPLTQ